MGKIKKYRKKMGKAKGTKTRQNFTNTHVFRKQTREKNWPREGGFACASLFFTFFVETASVIEFVLAPDRFRHILDEVVIFVGQCLQLHEDDVWACP